MAARRRRGACPDISSGTPNAALQDIVGEPREESTGLQVCSVSISAVGSYAVHVGKGRQFPTSRQVTAGSRSTRLIGGPDLNRTNSAFHRRHFHRPWS